MVIAYVYITRYSLGALDENTSEDKLTQIISSLSQAIEDYKKSDNITVESPYDFIDYIGDNTTNALQDEIYQIVDNDFTKFSFLLAELEKIITPYQIKYKDSSVIISSIQNQTLTFPRHYAFTQDKTYFWPQICRHFHTFSWRATLDQNSDFIAQNHNGSEEFISWSKQNYENLEFHSDIEGTLHTVKQGRYEDYKAMFSHALNTLNQSYYKISNASNQNEADLIIIRDLTNSIGIKKHLACSRQGANKPPPFKFPKSCSGAEVNCGQNHIPEYDEISCEYHLKIDTNDRDCSLPHLKKVRVYFGLKTYDHLTKKQIKVAHMGEHL
ncbi:hypothetical protein [Thiomicrospira sp. S5]|uniref:hypothetical protein n=1 Tax=Thiomicrospira sp. S5 TaxID=1803865 RepID=UPI000F8A08FE|nr:hypothetical protein [Thiomicrospira sp. S5]AZR82963.1 hypothetical protein AYJ59_12185 [Thiomicrospira sp. S5]